MSYRDELGQAHERIDELQDELREERARAAAAAAAAAPPTSPTPRLKNGRVVVFVAVAFVTAGAVATGLLLSVGPRGPRPLPIVDVDQLVQGDSRHAGEAVRASGLVVVGSTRRTNEPCAIDFVMQRGGRTMPVHVVGCILPERYTDAREIRVLADGKLGSDGTFVATQVLVPLPDL